jgi:hypothetical protein
MIKMNLYKVITSYEIGGNSEFCRKANTPFDACEKAQKYMGWREKERITKQTAIALDGSGNSWTFRK